MIEKIIEYSARNRVIILMIFALVITGHRWMPFRTCPTTR